MRLVKSILVVLIAVFGCLHVSSAEVEPIEVSVYARFYYPTDPVRPTTRRSIEIMREDPGIRIVQWSGLSLPIGGTGHRRSSGRSTILMSIAGKSAPDIIEAGVGGIRNDVKQGLLFPLNEWIGEDLDGNGLIDDDETTWEKWKTIPPMIRRVVTVDGKVYGIPQAYTHYAAMIYRTDLVRAAGLDPNEPPHTWDELIYWCQKLTDPEKQVPGAVVRRGQRGIVLLPYTWTWLPWIQTAGGSPLIQIRTSPSTGIDHEFFPEQTSFITTEGEDLSLVKPTWRANFASPEGIAAAELFHKLRWMPWIKDPETGEPINPASEEIEKGQVEFDGRTIEFTEEDLIHGMARAETGQRYNGKWELLGRGEVAMITWSVGDLTGTGIETGIDADLLSWFPIPKRPGGTRGVVITVNLASMVEAVGDRPKNERDAVWKVMTGVTDDRVLDAEYERRVRAGLARFVKPMDLQRLGFEDYLRDVPKVIRRNYEEMASGEVTGFHPTYAGSWGGTGMALNNQFLSLMISETGADFDYEAALKKIEFEANSGKMFGRSEEELARYRPYARMVFAVIAALVILFVVLIVRAMLADREGTTQAVYRGWLPWLMILPALILVGLWGYYPLFRGLVMALQDYRIAGESPFVGLDNFINLALDNTFWASMGRTVYFVVLNMVLAFLSPILLAVLLSEVPQGKVFFRTLFFLPQVTSGLVIALLWKLMYDPTPQGFFNQVIAILNQVPFVEIPVQSWLQDPRLAMICCVIPTVWASMGMASLIYLAALKSVPEEIYEAADVDGAGMFGKLRRITLPTLLPLIIINFVGTFVATFQNMGNIFLLTFGGPGEATMVVGMRIWIEAYNNLRFSVATSMAWVLGAVLIAFTYFQIRFLRRVEFKRAEWE